MAPKMYRQGDVLLVKVDNLPEGVEKKIEEERIVLAWGEVTGHAHAVSIADAELFIKGAESFLLVHPNGASLVHEEHATIALEPGAYRVVRQREYVPQSWRTVED